MIPKRGELWKTNDNEAIFIIYVGKELPFKHDIVKFYYLDFPDIINYTNVKDFDESYKKIGG